MEKDVVPRRKDDEDQLANGISRINLSELSMLNRTEAEEEGEEDEKKMNEH